MLLLAFWLAAVSYSQDVAPILAMRCHGCHGEAGGFSTRTYASLLAGGNLGRLVVPGDPDASLLTHFLDGRRGAQRRMPIGGKPLSGREMALIRQWIAEGAREDHALMAIQSKHITGLELPTGGTLRISAKVPGEGFVTVRVTDSASKVWFERVGAVKAEPEEADLGKPGDLLAWDVRSGTGWPSRLTVTLLVQYASEMQLELACR